MQNLLEGDEYDFRYNLGVATNTCAVRLEDREEIVSQLANHYAILQIKGADQIFMWPFTNTRFSQLTSCQTCNYATTSDSNGEVTLS